jgi:hypothetical protein
VPISKKTQLFDEARRLHERGYAVVPCAGKECHLPWWQTERLAPDELAEMYRAAGCNLAIVLNLSDVIDVECDTEEAEITLQQMFNVPDGGEIPPTPTWRSKRGLHRLFRRPSGLPERAVMSVEGIEFRIGNGKGALSVVPPSVHPDGPRYEWLPSLSIHDVTPVELPATIVNRLTEVPSCANTPVSVGIKEGNRNNQLFKIACKLVRSGVTPVAVEAALHAENLTR